MVSFCYLPAIAGFPGVVGVSAILLAVLLLLLSFLPLMAFAVASVPAHHGVHILAGGFTYWTGPVDNETY
jgi:hypothetical protein